MTNTIHCKTVHDPSSPTRLYASLLAEWCDGLVRLQAPQGQWPSLSGGIYCPACSCIHGRCADAVYPLLRRASDTGDDRYLNAAIRLQAWSDHVTLPDGSWLNDPLGHEWCGITVFGAIALGEALRHHGTLLDAPVRKRWQERLRRAVAYLDAEMTMETGNINYPISCSAAFAVAAQVLEEPRYLKRARAFAHDSLNFFTERLLIFGEGHPHDGLTPRGCRAVDLGYNVEESLPNLALYGVLTGDEEVLAMVTDSLREHLAFMLPDGGWDNSWGTRNYKWSYWGSRTSDGCQPAFTLLADRDPRFAEAARRNAELLAACTYDGILYGGPHYRAHGMLPCIHHTFCHAKAMAAVLDHGVPSHSEAVQLPRETTKGVSSYPEIATWLLAKGPWRATVTAYDWEYTPEGHAAGGAMSLLWHEKVGPLLTAGMIHYTSTVEVTNMQPCRDIPSQSLVPQLAMELNDVSYRSVNDFHARVAVCGSEEEGILVEVSGNLVDRNHQASGADDPRFTMAYHITTDAVAVTVAASAPGARYHLPLVSSHDEPVTFRADGEVTIAKPGGCVCVQSNIAPSLPEHSSRIFSPVPGHEAVPLVYQLCPEEPLRMSISVS